MSNMRRRALFLLLLFSCLNDANAVSPTCTDALALNKRREVRVDFDESGVYVYQAFTDFTAENALKNQRFLPGSGFKFNRMTWLKLSFTWMLYRSNFGHSPGQQRILRIKISHAIFLSLLEQAVPTQGNNPGPGLRKASQSDVVYQWDPDRDIHLMRTGRQLLQVGIRGTALEEYALRGILEITDVTDLARQIEQGKDVKFPLEKSYNLSTSLRHRLSIESAHSNDRS
jgi:hypothetical protein